MVIYLTWGEYNLQYSQVAFIKAMLLEKFQIIWIIIFLTENVILSQLYERILQLLGISEQFKN